MTLAEAQLSDLREHLRLADLTLGQYKGSLSTVSDEAEALQTKLDALESLHERTLTELTAAVHERHDVRAAADRERADLQAQLAGATAAAATSQRDLRVLQVAASTVADAAERFRAAAEQSQSAAARAIRAEHATDDTAAAAAAAESQISALRGEITAATAKAETLRKALAESERVATYDLAAADRRANDRVAALVAEHAAAIETARGAFHARLLVGAEKIVGLEDQVSAAVAATEAAEAQLLALSEELSDAVSGRAADEDRHTHEVADLKRSLEVGVEQLREALEEIETYKATEERSTGNFHLVIYPCQYLLVLHFGEWNSGDCRPTLSCNYLYIALCMAPSWLHEISLIVIVSIKNPARFWKESIAI